MLNGFAGPVAYGASAVLSSVWFPVNERAKATAFASILNGLGSNVGFIFGPLLIPTQINGTVINGTTGY